MEKLFIKQKDIKNTWSSLNFVVFFISTILTLGLSWIILYDYFFERKYMVNRLRLIKAINSNQVTIIKKSPADPKYFSDIEMFDLIDQKGNKYDLWLWTKSNGVIKATVGDRIGLFTGSLIASYLNRKLVLTIKKNQKNEY